MKHINNKDNPKCFPKTPLKWQGEEVYVECVWVRVWEYKEKPLWWFNFEVEQERSVNLGHNYAVIEALKIHCKNSEPFYISNQFGVGMRKLRKGGWPRQSHSSFGGKFEEIPPKKGWLAYPTKSFCLKDYERQERARRQWQKKNFPEEFEKSERLRKLIIKSPVYSGV